jgi:glucosyl-3-phosphoglycerate synthase
VGDFYQSGMIATFHKLGRPSLSAIETQLERYVKDRPIALVLPSLYEELRGEALGRMRDELRKVSYVREIVVTLGPASEEEFKKAKAFFSALPQKTSVIWNDGPAITAILEEIGSRDFRTGKPGKGRSVWMAFGYVLSDPEVHAVALHDCDIVDYDRSMLARLCYPVINPNLDYDFCKGYYARVRERMHGRVTRLLLVPLIRGLQRMIGPLPLLLFIDSFRYALAGEFSMDSNLARINRIPADWGLEVGLLAEVYRNTSPRRVCQVDIADGYEHKHQELSPHDPRKGLHKMAVDICTSLFRMFRSEGVVFSELFFQSLLLTYVQIAQDMLKRYEDDAALNCMEFDRSLETLAVDTFATALREASEIVASDTVGTPSISSWDTVTAAIPGVLEKIRGIVEEENR